MMPNQDSGSMSRLTSFVPPNIKNAVVLLAHERSTPYETVGQSEVGREAIEEYLSNHYDELPEEARDLLDDDLKANAGGE